MPRNSGYAPIPRWIWLPAALGALFVILPLVAMITRVDWSRFGELITSPSSVTSSSLEKNVCRTSSTCGGKIVTLRP